MGKKAITEKLVFIALLVALCVVLGILDNILSALVPTQGVRIGLANIVILTGIIYLSFREAFVLVLLKSFILGLFLGNPHSFIIGLSGSILSFFTMYLFLNVKRKYFSLMGVSVAGGIMHNIGQIIALIPYYSFVVVFNLFWLIPFGLGTGLFIGYIVSILQRYLNRGLVFKTIIGKK